jgi:CheY-like chemotaxis protein/anti-sigma regulatory factor (Ser/Thr protein kinase)
MHLKILIADDKPANVELLQSVADELGHQVVIARDGLDAVEKYQTTEPDLIFMDVMMPELSGIDAVRRIRELPAQHWVPIVFHSSLDTTEDIVHGLEAGGDDYLVKPASAQLIRAKINSYGRILAIQREVRGYIRELGSWREDAEEQNKLGQHVVNRLLDAEGLRDPMLQWMNTPAETFSGDLVCAARGPGNILYVMLADAAGHGLSAALTALPLTQVFYGMVGKGFPINTIAAELNRKLKSFLPIERFVAASLAAVDTRNQTIEIWNGGNPDVLFLDDDGSITVRWPSRHPPLGIMAPDQFNDAVEAVNYLLPGELILFSDGVIEVESPAGERLNLPGLEAILCSTPKRRRLEAMESGIMAHLAGRQEHDDLSSIVVQVPIERRQELRLAQSTAVVADKSVSEWRLDLSWGVSELRDVDVVPAVLGFMNQIHALQPHQGQLFLILSELFNNALDHGLLELDSRLKNMEGGFERYLEEREHNLKSLTGGRIRMSFHLHRPAEQAVLDIRLEDSGDGFEYAVYEGLSADGEMDPHVPHGRGIRLVQSLCEEVVYSGRGNVVSARYAL